MSLAMTSAGEARRLPRFASLAGLIAGALLLSPAVARAEVAPDLMRSAVDRDSRRDGELQDFYRKRGWRPLWLQGDALAPAAESLMKLVERADADGADRKALQF